MRWQISPLRNALHCFGRNDKSKCAALEMTEKWCVVHTLHGPMVDSKPIERGPV